MPQSFKHLRIINDFGIFGPSSGCVCMAPPHPVLHPSHVSTQGARPEATTAALAWHHRAQFGTAFTRFVAP
eukprot:9478350-Pyramimonas_sp.AAC.1